MKPPTFHFIGIPALVMATLAASQARGHQVQGSDHGVIRR